MQARQMTANAIPTAAPRPAAAPALPQRPLAAARRHPRTSGGEARSICAATQTDDPVIKFANNVGLPTDEGLFGFTPFSEVWVGRLSMLGFASGLVGEYLTGKGILQQVGLFTPNPALLGALVFVTGGATIFATGRTISRAQTGQLTAAELVRYRQFLGLQKEAQNIGEEEERLKQGFAAGKDIAAPDNLATIAKAKLEGTPADSVLGTNKPSAGPTTNGSDGAWMRDSAGPNQSLAARDDVLEQSFFSGSDWAYARNIEIQNGRWAMLGFYGAIVVEAGTGQGIIGQVVSYLKALGLLGQASGF